jgi:hypothetical protein
LRLGVRLAFVKRIHRGNIVKTASAHPRSHWVPPDRPYDVDPEERSRAKNAKDAKEIQIHTKPAESAAGAEEALVSGKAFWF